MTKEKYLETKKQARVWFTVNILISFVAITGGSLVIISQSRHCLLYTSPSPRDQRGSRMPSSA